MFDGHGMSNRHLLVRRRPKKLVLHFSQSFPDRSKGLFRCDLQPLKEVNKLLLWLTQPKTPHTCWKLWSLGFCRGSSVKCRGSDVEGKKSRVEGKKSRVKCRGSRVKCRGSLFAPPCPPPGAATV